LDNFSDNFMMKRREAVKFLSLAAGALLAPNVSQRAFGQDNLAVGSLSAAHETLLAELADVIIPTTDTPGAKAAGVEKFIIRTVRDCFSSEEREQFYAGLRKFEAECQSKFSAPYAALSSEKKVDFLKSFAPQNKTFFSKLKQLTVTGYFTSEIGATQALAYLPIPGRFQGSVSLEPGQKTWAL
jgi:hypothetical protein